MRNRGQGSDHLPTLLRQNHRNLDGGPSSCGQAVYLHAEERECVTSLSEHAARIEATEQICLSEPQFTCLESGDITDRGFSTFHGLTHSVLTMTIRSGTLLVSIFTLVLTAAVTVDKS